jgi:hypothetical protein
MSPKLTPALPLLVVFICAVSCTSDPSGDAAFPKKIVAMPENGVSTLPLTGQGDSEGESYLQLPKIALVPGEKLVQVLTTNLDPDEANEQVVITKRSDGATAPLRMIIADFENAERGYVRRFQTDLGATDDRTVRIDISDIIGNNTLQIVVSGMNAATQATLDAFRPVPSGGGRLIYQPFCRLASEGTIEIDESDSAGYSGGHRYGTSFPIIIYHSDPSSNVASALVKETFTYNYGVQAYTLRKSEHIQTEISAASRLTSLLQNSTPELLKKYIKGIWYKADELGKSDEKICAFDPEGENVAFYTRDVQEVYQWKYSRRSLFNTLQIYTESALLKSVQPNITVILHSPDELSIAVTEYSTMEQWLNEQWGGRYVKLDPAAMAAREGSAARAGRLSTPFFEGEYVSAEGTRINFTYPRFAWQNGDGGRPREGGFAVVEFPSHDATTYLLEMKVIEEQGLSITDLFYIIETSDVLKDGAPLSSFTLKPAHTSVYGVVDAKGPPLHFTRKAE